MSHYFLVPRLGLGTTWARQFWHDNCYHLNTTTTKSGLLHLCILSFLVLEVPSFLFAYFTIALNHGVNEIKNIILFTLCLPQLLYSEDTVLTLLLILTSPVTIYPADGLSCSFVLNLKRFFLSKFDKKLPKLHILIQ